MKHFTICATRHIVYLLTCPCKKQYVEYLNSYWPFGMNVDWNINAFINRAWFLSKFSYISRVSMFILLYIITNPYPFCYYFFLYFFFFICIFVFIFIFVPWDVVSFTSRCGTNDNVCISLILYIPTRWRMVTFSYVFHDLGWSIV